MLVLEKHEPLFPQILSWWCSLFGTGTNCLWSVSATHCSHKKRHENLQNKSKTSSLNMPAAYFWQNLQHINHRSSVLTSQRQEDVQIFCMEVSAYNFLVLSNSEYFHHLLSLFMRSCISKPSHICTLVGLKKHNSLSQTLSMPQKELAIRQATEVGTWDKHRKKEFVTGEH